MGFTSGLLGGFTLTTTIVYLSLNLHARNRLHQSALLHQQAVLLNGVVEPEPAQPLPINREVRTGLLETAKDRWNAELEKNVRTLQDADWASARLRLEEKVSLLWSNAFQKSREGVAEVTK